MKKMLNLFSWFATLLLLVTGCAKTDVGTEEILPQTHNPEMRFYGVKTPGDTRGAAQRDRLWANETTIKVKFVYPAGATPNAYIEAKVIEFAKEWENYANITFKFVESGDAHVRVGFDWNDNRTITWSYVGTDCKANTDQEDATLSFAYFDAFIGYPEGEEVMRGDVLRAFGQVLGLELESRNLNFTPRWLSEARARSYWATDMSDVEWEEMKKYVFDALDEDNGISSEYDPSSIMNWPFPKTVLVNGNGDTNLDLSAGDIAFIGELYPGKTPPPPGLVARIGSDIDITDYIVLDGDVTGVWNAENSTYDISTTTTADVVYGITVNSGDVFTLDFSASKGLDFVKLHEVWSLSELTFQPSAASALKKFDLESSYIYWIDFSNFSELKEVRLVYNPFNSGHLDYIDQIAATLPDRTGKTAGTFIVGQDDNVSPFLDICAGKNWNVTLSAAALATASHQVTCNPDANAYWTQDAQGRWTLYGIASTVTSLTGGGDVTSLDVFGCKSLQTVDMQGATSLTSLLNLKSTALTTLDVRNCNLSSLVLGACPALKTVYCEGNPFLTNQSACEAFGRSLPTRATNNKGVVHVASGDKINWIWDYCDSRGWNMTPLPSTVIATFKGGQSGSSYSFVARPGYDIVIDYQGGTHSAGTRAGTTINVSGCQNEIKILASSHTALEAFRGKKVSSAAVTDCDLKLLELDDCGIRGFTAYSWPNLEYLGLDNNPLTLLMIENRNQKLELISLKGVTPFTFSNPYGALVLWQ